MTMSQADHDLSRQATADYSNTLFAHESAQHIATSPSTSPSSTDGEGLPLTNRARSSQRRIRKPLRRSTYTRWTETMDNSRVYSWLKGPNPPHQSVVKPIFPALHTKMQSIQIRFLPRKFSGLFVAIALIFWVFAFGKILTDSSRAGLTTTADSPPLRLACNDRLWPNASYCGLHGKNCEPFSEHSFTFACPADCASVQVLEPHFVGSQEILYSTMVIGGASTGGRADHVYRGDSFICQSAIHAGLFTNSLGGCGRLERNGAHGSFAASSQNTISSIEFLPSFPLTYKLSATEDTCADPQWTLFGLSLITTIWLSILDISVLIFFTSTSIIVFSQVALASDRPLFSSYANMVSMATERFLPTVFVLFVLYKFCVHHTLHGIRVQLEKPLFWLSGCWIGALNNYTFDRLPISRLTAHDLQQQPGAITTLVVLVAGISFAAVGQVLSLRAEGRLPKYIGIYLVLGILLGLLAVIPNLQLRLHHYIIALLLLPGTCIRTRRSMLYQGLLFGLLVNGIARWGYASILQTAEALREDGIMGSALPQILQPDIFNVSSISLSVKQLVKGFDGVSILVNDVERYHQLGGQSPFVFEWTRNVDEGPTYFRFGFTNTLPLGGTLYGDYTKPSTWHLNGTWSNWD